MEIKTTVKVTERPSMSDSSIGRRWATSGATRFDKGFLSAEIQLTFEENHTTEMVKDMTLLHERGHVWAAQDMVDGLGHGKGGQAMQDSDRWNGEVEAWVRVLETAHPGTRMLGDMMYFEFILDCLNSYRRGLGVSDRKWNEMIELMTTFYSGDADDVRNYVPLEPDPGEPPAKTCGWVESVPMGKDPEPDDSEGDGDEDGDDEGSRPEHGEGDRPGYVGEQAHGDHSDGSYDERWLDQDIIDELNRGIKLAEVAAHNGLDISRIPPLIEAMGS